MRKAKKIKRNIFLTYLDAKKARDIPCLSLKGFEKTEERDFESSNGDPVPSFLFRMEFVALEPLQYTDATRLMGGRLTKR